MGEKILIKEDTNTIIFKSTNDFKNLDEFIEEFHISKRLYRNIYRNKNIKINGKFQRKDLSINKNDEVIIFMEEEDNNIECVEMELNIIYEDMDMLIINKEAYMPVHTNRYYQKNTLLNGLAYYFRDNNINKKVRIVNRLDMDTSGLLIIAKSQYIDQQISQQFKDRKVIKKYLALVEGVVKENKGFINKNILTEDKTKKIIDRSGKEALTNFKVIERYRDKTLLEVEIITGRSHQIRLHLASIGYPIVGDDLYGSINNRIGRQALHSYYLELNHPRSKEKIKFTSDLPLDIKRLTENL